MTEPPGDPKPKRPKRPAPGSPKKRTAKPKATAAAPPAPEPVIEPPPASAPRATEASEVVEGDVTWPGAADVPQIDPDPASDDDFDYASSIGIGSPL